jgi:hypothetical protein
MKLNGKKIEGPNEVTIVIPRGSGEDIVLKARAVLDLDDFEEMCPLPTPPSRRMAGGADVPNLKDQGYVSALQRRNVMRLNYIVLSSLEATEGLEWETVDISDSNTWDNFNTELKDAGFSPIEIQRIVADILNVNALDEAKIEEARQRFLLAAQEAHVV